ncbi:Rha family transcriptional regulator [Pseudomonas sp. NFR16]|uniref:Rha family transcriptional regulator n=1 Tax=Pseudomonas sp. NFR16 TaxID=1566248 RepID=UPI0008CD46E5|nr:Rha family transcriptional regulator [Pseudomonas sp. NFR16]SEI67081.1 Phage regulatory protein Rha (Phage_pRha) [Pseudomonas sp. NFR16]
MHSHPTLISTPEVGPRFHSRQNTACTMSSREIASVTRKAHKHVLRDIREMMCDLEKEGPILGRFAEEKDACGYTTAFHLDRDLTDTLMTRYSACIRYAVIRRWSDLEDKAAWRQTVKANGTKVIGEIAIMECFTRLLKPAPSSQMLMLIKIAENNGLDPKFLPGYAVDAAPDAAGGSSMPTKSATALLKEHGIRYAPATFNRALACLGYLKQMQRRNSKGETVDFWCVTEKGLAYGKNLTSPQSPRETQPHWYGDRFVELARMVGKA